MAGVAHVIAVAGPVGAGKSTLVGGLAKRLAGAAVVHFDHYEQVTAQPIEKIEQWMREGADLDAISLPRLAEHLLALKAGRSVTDPATGAAIEPAAHILFETQFGRRHAETGRHIDLLIWVDTPLDVALARKLRQLTPELEQCGPDATRDFVLWLRAYLDNYLAVVGRLLRMQKESVGAGADLVVDGTRESGELQEEVIQFISERLR